MKNLLLAFFVLLSLNVFSQDFKYSDLLDNNVKKNVFKVYKSYLSKDGLYFKSGDTIKVGFPSADQYFAFITLHQGGGEEFLKKSDRGVGIIIKDFMIIGTKKTGFCVIAVCKTDFFMSKYEVKIENALASKEIRTSFLSSDEATSFLSSDEALTKLKKAKDKLDLGLITQEEFDKLKSELKKFIK